MRTVLLVTDLEGVAGVDSIPPLMSMSSEHEMACELLTAEVLAAVAGFQAAGFDRIRISDSHRPGGTAANVIAARLPPGVELDWRVEGDAYAADLFDGTDAVACLGMHAAAGAPGFAAHTVSLHAGWWAGGRPLSESDLVLGLAAERGVPAIFVSGDDVLHAELAGRVPYVVTKAALSRSAARSRAAGEVHAALRAAAQAPPVPSPPLPDGGWQLRFRSRWPEALLGRAGARVSAEGAVAIDGRGARECYSRGLELLQLTETPVGRALRAFEPLALAADVAAALDRRFERAPPPSTSEPSRRALAAFLRHTDGDADWQLADRALILHMLEGHAPGFFAAAGLGPTLERAVARLDGLTDELPLDLDPYVAMWRVDGVYVRACRGRPHPRLAGLLAYARENDERAPLHTWLIWEMATQIGLARPLRFPPRPMRRHSRMHDLYWLTHLFLLATWYLRRPLDPAAWEAEIEELCLAAPELLATEQLELAAEVAFCLQLAGEGDSAENRAILAALVARQQPDGTIAAPATASDIVDREAHTAGAALLALARYA